MAKLTYTNSKNLWHTVTCNIAFIELINKWDLIEQERPPISEDPNSNEIINCNQQRFTAFLFHIMYNHLKRTERKKNYCLDLDRKKHKQIIRPDLGKCGDKSLAISVNPTLSLPSNIVFNLSSHMISFLFSGFYIFKTKPFLTKQRSNALIQTQHTIFSTTEFFIQQVKIESDSTWTQYIVLLINTRQILVLNSLIV